MRNMSIATQKVVGVKDSGIAVLFDFIRGEKVNDNEYNIHK